MTNNVVAPVGRSFLFYGAAFVVAGMVPFLLLPLLTKKLSPQEFGEATAFIMFVTMFSNIGGLSAHGYVSVRFFKESREEFAVTVWQAIIFLLGSHLIVGTAVLVGLPIFSSLIGLSPCFVVLGILGSLALSINLILLAVYQISGKPHVYFISRFFQSSIEFSLCILMLLFVSADARSRIFSYTAALVVTVGGGVFYALKNGFISPERIRKKEFKLFSFGLPLVPHILAGTAITYLDRIMITSLLGVNYLGVYMAGLQIGMAMSVFIEPINKTFAPWLFGELAKNSVSVRLNIVRKTYLYYGLLALLGILVFVFSRLLFDRVIGKNYLESSVVIPWVIMGFVCQGMYYSVVNYIFYAEKTAYLSTATTMTVAIGSANSYFLISRFGLLGAGMSFGLNNLILFAIVWFVASRTVPMPWALRTRRYD